MYLIYIKGFMYDMGIETATFGVYQSYVIDIHTCIKTT
jgi:hypothetical protein